MVRKLSNIWGHFENSTDEKDRKTVICKYCKIVYHFPNATRMKNHVAKLCIKCPYDVRASFNETEEDPDDEGLIPIFRPTDKDQPSCSRTSTVISPTSSNQSFSSSQSFTSASPSPSSCNSLTGWLSKETSSTSVPLHKLQSSASSSHASRNIMSSFLDKMTQDEQEKIDQAVSRAIYASGAPLSLLENQYWTEAFRLLRPMYKKPTMHAMREPLLEAEYGRVKQATDQKITQALCLGLITDGWTNICGEGIVNFMITTPEPVFYKSIEPGTDRETAEYIGNEIIKVIEEIGSGKFLAVVTDNASNMKAAWKIVTTKFDHISCIGCASHGLNLLLKDIMELNTVDILYKKAKHIIKYFKNSHIALASLKKKQEEKYGNKANTLKLPSKTRWGAIVISFHSLISNKEALQLTVLIEELKMDKAVRRNVLDEDIFWVQLETTVNILEPITKAITKSEADYALLSDIPQLFADIKKEVHRNLPLSSLSKSEEEKVKNAIDSRQLFIVKPIHCASNLLDPQYKGGALNDEEIIDAFDYIVKISQHLGLDEGDVLANLAEYRTSTGFFTRPAIWLTAKKSRPIIWWQGLCSSQALAQVASRLLNMPPSSAASERNWSLFGSIHSKSRNRLLNSRVQKLVAIKAHLMGSTKKTPKVVEVEDNNGTESTDSDSVSDVDEAV